MNEFAIKYNVSAEVATYLDNVFRILKKHSIKRHRINWRDLNKLMYRHARGSQINSETYGAIRKILKKLGDKHSFIMLPIDKKGKTKLERKVGWKFFKKQNIGYILLPSFASGDPKKCNQFAENLQNIISKIDKHNPAGWVIDLRKNSGGNMWPMIAGLGPLLGNGRLGSFVFPSGKKSNWYYKNGNACEGNNCYVKIKHPYKLRSVLSPVAILIGEKTNSSGEAIVVAFRGRKKTLLFGKKTAGRTTANRGFNLSDGAMLFLTVAIFADRNGKIYGNDIKPDKSCEGEETLRKAFKWLTGKAQ